MNICGAPMEESIKDEVSKVSGRVKKKNWWSLYKATTIKIF